MAEYKKQHYVPQFYFNFFSKDGKNINIYNLKQDKIFNRPIKHLCCKSSFYSKNKEIEKCFNELENNQARVIKKILRDGSLLELSEVDYYSSLLSFILFQMSRTKTERERSKEMSKIFSDEVIKPMMLSDKRANDMGITKEMLDKYDIVHNGDHLMKICISLQSIPLISDLVPILMINKTKLNFIFSDTPVIKHNTFFNHIKNSGTKGFQSTGLQIFSPLDDRHMLMFFDSDFYDVELKRPNLIEINENNDIDSLNSLQYIYRDENIFFSDEKDSKYVKKLQAQNSSFIKEIKVKKEKIILPMNGKGHREIIHTYESNTKYPLKLSFVKLKETTKRFGIRNPKLLEENNKFWDDKKKIK